MAQPCHDRACRRAFRERAFDGGGYGPSRPLYHDPLGAGCRQRASTGGEGIPAQVPCDGRDDGLRDELIDTDVSLSKYVVRQFFSGVSIASFGLVLLH